MKKENVLKISSALCLTLCGLLAYATNKEQENKTVEVLAANDIETSTGITISKGTSVNVTATDGWKSKVLVMEVKGSDNEIKFQLGTPGGDGGLIGTDAGVSSVKYESQKYTIDNTLPYWGTDSYSVDIGDGWYRWVVDLSDFKYGSMSDQITRIKCHKGSNVQVRNLKFYDEMYVESVKLCSTSYGFLNANIENWGTQTVRFDIKLADDTQRRFQLCKDSGNALSGLIVCTKTALKYENPANDPYLLTDETAPVSLGDDWYRFVFDLSKVKKAEGRTGAETLVKIKNIPSTDDGNPTIEIKNFKLNIPDYNPADDADVVLKTNSKTTLPDITAWSLATISFEVYHDSLDLSCDPQFIFYKKGTDANITDYFGYKNIGGTEALYVRNASGNSPYWAQTTTQPVLVENGWYKWTMDLSELKGYNSTGLETIGAIFNRGSKDVYIRNFSIDSSYNPANDADMTWNSGNNVMKDADGDLVVVQDWAARDTVLSFKVFDFQNAFINNSNNFSFASEKANESTDITKDNRTSNKCSANGNGQIIDSTTSTVVGTYTALTDDEIGWYQVNVETNKVGATDPNRALRYIRIGKSGDIYVKDLTVTQQTAPYDAIVYDHGFVEIDEGMAYWSQNAFSFKTFGTIVPVIGLSDGTNITEEEGGNNISATFTAKDGKVYWDTTNTESEVGTYTALTGDEAGWYEWNIDLRKVPTKGTGVQTATHLWVRTPAAKFTSFMFKDIEYTLYKYTVKFGADDEGVELDFGSDVVAPTQDPTKEATAKYTYTFDGWYDGDTKLASDAKVTKDVTYEAKFNSTINKYVVKFGADDKGTEIEYDAEIVAPTQAPTKEATVKYTYTFDGWYAGETKLVEGTKVTGNVTYEAKFTETINKYSVKFGDAEATQVEYDAEIIAPQDPTKEATAKYTYTFDGWYVGETKFVAGTKVTGNVTYEAKFTETINKYTVKFGANDKGAELEYDSTITAPEQAPTKEATAKYTYTFDGWYAGETKFVAGTKVTGNVTYEAKFTETINKYSVKFGDAEATQVEYDAEIVAPQAPTKEATAKYTYTFDGWYAGETKLVAGTKVTGNVTYEAKFTETINKYSVKFGDAEATQVEYDAEIVAPQDPTKEATAKYTYTFDGWYVGETKLVAGTKVTGDVTYEAKFTETVNKYSVKFGDAEASELEYDAEIIAPQAPTKAEDAEYTYTFDGWYAGETKFVEGTKVTGNVTYEAKFTSNKKEQPGDSSSTSEEPSPSSSEEPSESSSQAESSSSIVDEVKKGCGGAAIPSVIGLLSIAGALLVSKKRR